MNFAQIILSVAAHLEWKIHQIDVKSAFLYANFIKEIYMEQPPIFVTNSSLVCQLKKSLYGLK